MSNTCLVVCMCVACFFSIEMKVLCHAQFLCVALSGAVFSCFYEYAGPSCSNKLKEDYIFLDMADEGAIA